MSHGPKLDMSSVMSVWIAIQTNLAAVPRWEKYLKAAAMAGDTGRPQNSLQHSYSMAVLGTIILPRLAAAKPLDTGLVMLALLLHDIGEGEIGYDTAHKDKTAHTDLKEYEAFCQRIVDLDVEVRKQWTEAFLLQFALGGRQEFPTDERIAMKFIRETRWLECLAFDAIERYDYVLYAREQFETRRSTLCLVWTLRNQLPRLRELASQLPGFCDIWHPELDAWAEKVLTDYADIEEEKKAG